MTDEVVDIKLNKDEQTKVYDFGISDDGDFEGTFGFDSSLINSIGTQKRADKNEVPEAKRRSGWIGNENLKSLTGLEIGSKLWLKYQARQNLETKNEVVDFLKDSLLPNYVPDLCDDVEVEGDLRSDGLYIGVIMLRKSVQIDKVYFRLWEATGI